MDQLNNKIQENWYSLNIDETTVFQYESCLKDKKKCVKSSPSYLHQLFWILMTILLQGTLINGPLKNEKQYNYNQLLFNAQMLVIHVFNKE